MYGKVDTTAHEYTPGVVHCSSWATARLVVSANAWRSRVVGEEKTMVVVIVKGKGKGKGRLGAGASCPVDKEI